MALADPFNCPHEDDDVVVRMDNAVGSDITTDVDEVQPFASVTLTV